MDKERLQDILAKHNRWLKGEEGGERADLRGADLTGANLWRANLRDADLRNADLDYSCLPLWCGSKGMIVDCRIAAQIAAHFCALSCDDPDFLAAREAVLPFAQTSHRAMELGINDDEVSRPAGGAGMNEGTYNTLLEIVKRYESGDALTRAEKDALVYAVKHMLPHELRTSGMYTQAREFEEQYGIH